MGWEWLVRTWVWVGEPPQMHMHTLAHMLIMINMLVAIGNFLTYIFSMYMYAHMCVYVCPCRNTLNTHLRPLPNAPPQDLEGLKSLKMQ